MSNFTGVTFSQQKVLPSDDAIIRRSILSDGVLYGCEFSYSGYTLTMGSGQMLICGRQIRHPSAQNWAVNDATSGFARLVLTVDLTRTASKDVFDQVVDSIEYATDKDGFSELVQTDVNVSGTRYQVAACVVSLGSGGITGIVEQLGPCEASGGGGLNFKVVGGLTQPANPAENTIWVATDIPISGYAFSASEPAEPVEGMVWISVGTSGTAEFNALKKNVLMVYPIFSKQYVNGAWADREAKSYQNAVWVDWFVWDGELYIDGNEYEADTGGWTSYRYKASGDYTGVDATLIENDGYTLNVTLTTTAQYRSTFVSTRNLIDLSDYNTVEIKISEATGFDASANGHMRIWVCDEGGQTVATTGTFATASTQTLDISALTGKYRVGVLIFTGPVRTMTMKLESAKLIK